MVSVTIRALHPDEAHLLQRATVENFNWSSERFTTSEVMASPAMVYYTEFIPTRGDFGYLALIEDEPVGVVWAQFLPQSRPGWGFVDASTPELSLWVEESSRRQGIGRALIRALQHEARRRDLPGLSISVEAGNPARDLYLSEGFSDVEGKEADGVMLWRTS